MSECTHNYRHSYTVNFSHLSDGELAGKQAMYY